MSKLANIRANNNQSQGAIFSSNVDAPVANIFARIQGKKTAPLPTATNNGQRKKYKPSKFYLKKGDKKTLVIVDEQFTFAMREHNVKGADGFWKQHRCINDYDACPACGLPDNRPYDLAILTVLDLTPWEKDGITHEFTKRYMALKKGDYEKFQTIAQMQGLRGVVLEMERGHEEKESANGKPTFINKLSEDDLIEAFGSPEKLYPSGFVLAANNAIVAFDYANIFTVPTRDELAAELGMAPRPGSKAETQAEDNTVPWDESEVETLDLSEEYPTVD